MFALKIIVILILLSGIIAYTGDLIGRAIGRRRLSIFGLRPKHTAIGITIFSGILIAGLTLVTFLVISREARLALFGMEELREKIVALEGVKNRLEKEIETRRVGAVMFKNGEVVLTTIVSGKQDRPAVESKISQVIGFLELYVGNLNGGKKTGGIIQISKEKIGEAADEIYSKREDHVVQVVVLRNVMFGENVPVELKCRPNRLVFYKGEVIGRAEIDPGQNDPEIEQELKILLSEARVSSQQKGVIPDASGSVGSIPYAEIFDAVKMIKEKEGMVVVKLVASRPIYSIGPLSVSFEL